MGPEELLQGLTDPQREAVTHTEGPLLVLAGPGSGKTRVITHRAAYLARTVTGPRHILAVTFTNKAANEMGERIRRLAVDPGITCSTFHAFCARLLRIHADRVEGIEKNFSIFDDADQTAAMKEAIDREGLSADNFPPGKILSRIGRAKNDMISAQEFEEQSGDWQAKTVARVYHAYEAILAEQNALDFDDLLVRTARLLGEDAELRDRLQDRYRYVLVDEYQDTNHAQYLIARGLAFDHENLCVTGDPDQSIYAWRGANLHNILEFEEDFPDAVVIRLEQNYRSTPQILAAADAVIAHNRKRKKKTLWTDKQAGPSIRVAECEDAIAEADSVASEIARHVESGGRYADVAIFYRINALSRSIEAALRKLSIPYQVARGVAFYQRKEIKDVLAYLKVVANPLDRVALLRIINVPARGIGKTTVQRVLAHAEATGQTALEAIADPGEIDGITRAVRHLRSFADLLGELATVADRGGVQDTIEWLVRHSGLSAMWSQADDEDAISNVHELISAAAEYDHQHADGAGSLTDWLQQVSLVSDLDAVDPEIGAVTLMTLHAAKGLEFDTVFIVGVEDGLLPHRRSETERADIEEERRLCFVGMTRAQRALTMTCVRWRDYRGMTKRTSRSTFLAELPDDGVDWITVDGEGITGHQDADDQPIPASSVDFLEWRRGQLVRHPEYGLGRVMWIRPASRGTYAGVEFNAYGQKTLVLEYANLELVELNGLGQEP